MDKETMLVRLQKRFPSMWFKDGHEFDGGGAVAWSGEGAMIHDFVHDVGMPAFDYYSTSYVDYEMGVHVDLVAFCKLLGCHWVCHDAETYLLYED